jgi:hypothetical protein
MNWRKWLFSRTGKWWVVWCCLLVNVVVEVEREREGNVGGENSVIDERCVVVMTDVLSLGDEERGKIIEEGGEAVEVDVEEERGE